jgi:hypothetical protein
MPRRLNRLAGQERYTTVLLDLQGFSLRGSDDFWVDMVGYILKRKNLPDDIGLALQRRG